MKELPEAKYLLWVSSCMLYEIGEKKPPRYTNPKAEDFRGARAPKTLEPWRFGCEITGYNNRGCYTDGQAWGYSPGAIDWVEKAGRDFVEVPAGAVAKTLSPRLCWEGYTTESARWHGQGRVRGLQLMVHRDDIYPMAGGGRASEQRIIATGALGKAEEMLKRGELVGAAWRGTRSLVVEFPKTPTNEQLETLGVRRVGPEDKIVDFTKPADTSCVLLPHGRKSWAGLENVVVEGGGREGVSFSSFVVKDPEKAKQWFAWAGKLPAGCRVTGTFFGGGGADGSLIFAGGHLPPLKPTTQAIRSVQRVIRRKASLVVKISDIDFEAIRRVHFGEDHSGPGWTSKQAVILSPSKDGFTPSYLGKRKHLIDDDSIREYLVYSPEFKGNKGRGTFYISKKLQHQKSSDPQKKEQICKNYSPVVDEERWHLYSEDQYRDAFQLFAKISSEGFMETAQAAEKSCVPHSIFFDALKRGLVSKHTIETNGRSYAKPLTFSDFQREPKLIDLVLDFAKYNDDVWILQLALQNHGEFSKRMLCRALGA